MPDRSGQPRAQSVDLIVQTLLSGLALTQQPTAEPDCGQQGIVLVGLDLAAVTLTGQVRQRRTVSIVSFEPTRPELGAGGSGLRRREQAHRSRETLVQLGHPGAMQSTRRLDRDHRPTRPAMTHDQPLELIKTRPRHRQRQRFDQQPVRVSAEPDPIPRLARLTATTSVSTGSAR